MAKPDEWTGIDYKFNEGELVRELGEYIDATYDGHYSKNNFQSTEFIVDCGHGIGFSIGNILKYAQRYGRKGSSEDHRKDLMKVLHYAIIALSIHDDEIEGVLDHLPLPEIYPPDHMG